MCRRSVHGAPNWPSVRAFVPPSAQTIRNCCAPSSCATTRNCSSLRPEPTPMSQSMAWLMLVIAGLLDVGWAISMKYTEGYTRAGWSIVSLVLLVAFVVLLGRALKVLEVGVAYSVWTGIGAAGTVVVGVALFGETLSAMKMIGIALVLTGIVALKLA